MERPASKITIQKIRLIWFGTTAAEFIAFMGFVALWMVSFAETMHVWWLIVPALSMHLVMHNYREKYCRCPHCNTSLLGFDGDNIFAKTCEKCGERF